MRKRPGKFVNYMSIHDTYCVEVAGVPYEGQQERTEYIRDNLRRGDWSKLPWPITGEGRVVVRYLFVDQEDAMMFKLRFG